MSLVSSQPAALISSSYSLLIQGGLSGRPLFASSWQSAYHSYAQQGVGSICAAGPGDSQILYDGIYSLWGYSEDNTTHLAQMFANYWATSHLVPSGPAVSIVSNDALTRVSQFDAAIKNARTNSLSTPYFKGLIDSVESVVKTIVWTGIDSNGSTVTGTIA